MDAQYQNLIKWIIVLSFFNMNFSAQADGGNLLPGQTNAPGLVDPVTMPSCYYNTCWQYNGPPPRICPLIDGPCANNSEASDNGGDQCGMKQYTRECYCNLQTGLSCAWSCNWESWWDTEDWFAKLCPDSPALKLDFSSLPNCARRCLDDAIFEYGCLTQSSNCFCTHGTLFGCHDKCTSDEEWERIAEWLQDACSLDADQARLALEEGAFTLTVEPGAIEATGSQTRDFGPPPPVPAKPLSWDEYFIIVILALTGTGIIGMLTFRFIASPQRIRLASTSQ
ncbi:uncharacterized protein Z518_07995 [Rhinocladiella mackenziei CBS 650.93]|uniref:Rhinocladiella mackenziei CBS 650.93 unplaced genomic scaffold supercont1.6, whole genome shotgun sequence n=1 Tax=Rhinocladiella mackenziei CBS 650.93 TaxID=1442369 RepID=A0A0D2IFM3_9EURO|nr:uncharacterized protein Z518_07995 [Rhinocladiella mackenziei CBS 650.93]KIX02056.1 hypothetical protein Z518_07995 [Rhinocladiella mackenziei CBS 650.93]